MAKAFQKIYTQITAITKATCSLKAEGVGNDELATVNGKLAQVVKIMGDDVTLQVFEGTEGIPTNAEVVFLGKAPSLKVSEQLAGRFFNAYGDLYFSTLDSRSTIDRITICVEETACQLLAYLE